MCSFESYEEFFCLSAKAVTSHLSLQCQSQIWMAFTSKAKVPPTLALVFDPVASLGICQSASPDPPPDLTRQGCEDTRSTYLPAVPWAGTTYGPGQVPGLSLTPSSLQWLVSRAWVCPGCRKLKIPSGSFMPSVELKAWIPPAGPPLHVCFPLCSGTWRDPLLQRRPFKRGTRLITRIFSIPRKNKLVFL